MHQRTHADEKHMGELHVRNFVKRHFTGDTSKVV
jgi:hypothetical protein